MQSTPEINLYEYSVIRYVPRVEREEFINIGLVMMCKRKRWIKVLIHLDEVRIRSLFKDADLDLLSRQLASFEKIAAGDNSSPIGVLEPHERFRWLTAVRSACISTSRPHPGHSADLEKTFHRLFNEQIATDN